MHRRQCINCLDFYNDFFVYHDIESLTAQEMPAIVNLNRLLSDERYATGGKFDAKGLFVKLLEKSWPQLLMHLKCGIQNLLPHQFDGLRQWCIPLSGPGFLRHLLPASCLRYLRAFVAYFFTAFTASSNAFSV